MSPGKLVRNYLQADDMYVGCYVDIGGGELLRVDKVESLGEDETLEIRLHFYGGWTEDLDPEHEVHSWIQAE